MREEQVPSGGRDLLGIEVGDGGPTALLPKELIADHSEKGISSYL
jgi:hypothetical protein